MAQIAERTGGGATDTKQQQQQRRAATGRSGHGHGHHTRGLAAVMPETSLNLLPIDDLAEWINGTGRRGAGEGGHSHKQGGKKHRAKKLSGTHGAATLVGT